MKRRSTDRYNSILVKKSSLCMLLASMLILTSLCLFVFSSFADAHSSRETCYKSICIQEGDTLTQIAKTYMTDDYDNCYDYIEEIKRINHISDGDLIHADCYLVVPCYADQSSYMM